MHTVVVDIAARAGVDEAVASDLERIGGTLGWYGAAPGWVLRLLLGRLVGEHLRRQKPDLLEEGALVDWWRIARIERGELVLRGVGWFSGDAWLGFRVRGGSLRQVAAFRPRCSRLLYWKLLWPVHDFAFHRMARHRIRRATRSAPVGARTPTDTGAHLSVRSRLLRQRSRAPPGASGFSSGSR